MGRDWTVIAAWTAGICFTAVASLTFYLSRTPPNQPIRCAAEITPKHTRKQIEEIVNSVNTPRDAFFKVSEDLIINEEIEVIAGCDGRKRTMSMQESYATGYGDCAEGAVAFAAILSDNPEYKVKVYTLWDPENNPHKKHVVAVYEENNDWGIVSFNNSTYLDRASAIKLLRTHYFYEGAITYDNNKYPDDVFNFITPAKFESIDEVFVEWSTAINDGKKMEHRLRPFTPEELKFGKELQTLYLSETVF